MFFIAIYFIGHNINLSLLVNGIKISHCQGTPNNQNDCNGRLTGFGTVKAQLKVGDQLQVGFYYLDFSF